MQVNENKGGTIMKKNYYNPEIKLVLLTKNDVVTVSITKDDALTQYDTEFSFGSFMKSGS